MTDAEQREAARQFVNRWREKGNEDEDGRSYWLDFLANVMGVENPTELVNFEKKVVVDGNTKRIDIYIPETHVLIEQKSKEKALDQKIHNSGGIELTPYEQAKRYNDNLPYEEKARWIITSNFTEIWAYDMNARIPEPVKISLMELPSKYPLLNFLVKQDVKKISHEMEVSIQAGDIVGLLYDAFLRQYRDPGSERTLKSLNVLCVRLVFCLYAEDAGIFGKREIFHDYLAGVDTMHMRNALIDLFRVLDQKSEERDPYLIPELAAFPYVNGGLFADENIEIPMLTDEIRDLILVKASENFNWSEISPTIFGAVFESTLNPETRRSGGMHYTSIENIHKVIDPLFLDDLKKELEDIKSILVLKTRKRNLEEYQAKLASLEFLDPAAGSGNFLTETYLSIRRLENESIRTRLGGQITIGDVSNPIQVSISQFHGIEINDFAVTVAKTALWIAESQMMKETENILYGTHLEFLPLKTNANIVEANALRIDWNDVIPAKKLNYIMGNPPFVGYALQSSAQKADLDRLLPNIGKNIDYVLAWYYQSAPLMRVNSNIRAAFVSTNSICQGEQVSVAWRPLLERYNVHIDFAYRTFRWDSEASLKAHVHCIIVGFSEGDDGHKKIIFDVNESKHIAKNINAYLLDGPNIFIESRKKSICDVPEIVKGSSPVDGGAFFLTMQEKQKIEKTDAIAAKYIHRFLGAKEFIHNQERYCLWLLHVDPADIIRSDFLKSRIEAVRVFRQNSTKAATRKYAEFPSRFMEIRQPESNYVLVPRHSSANRRYVPFGFMTPDTICGDANNMIPNATVYHFGILISNVHMSWMRAVCGRIKSDYRYSNDIVYNNFPWPAPTYEQKNRIERTAQSILDARALYPDSSLADLYDPLTMPPELRKAHVANDKAVMTAYGFSTKMSEEDCVAELMKMYQRLVKYD